jgi:Cu(I)/Ag(I) efflux system membrane fusion protein
MFATVILNIPPRSRSRSEQTICPVTRRRLGSMGPAVRVQVGERTVWVCCAGCVARLKSVPEADLARQEAPPGDGVLSVPESAVIDTGRRTIVYIEAEPGVYEGREVTLGPRIGDHFPVLEGLAPGEKVAAGGAFLIDAESRLNPATRPPGPGVDHPPGPSPPRANLGAEPDGARAISHSSWTTIRRAR